MLANDELLTAAEIESHLTGQPIVFLNACRSAVGAVGDEAEDLITLDHGGDGLTSAFIQGGALAVTGSLWPIHDAGSADLALSIYHQALRGAASG